MHWQLGDVQHRDHGVDAVVSSQGLELLTLYLGSLLVALFAVSLHVVHVLLGVRGKQLHLVTNALRVDG